MSFSEIGLVAIIALVVLGPKQLPEMTRQVGLWIRRWRVLAYKVQAGIRELEKQQRLAENEARAKMAETAYKESSQSTAVNDDMR